MDYMGYQYPYQPMNNMFRPSMSSMSSMNGFIKVNGIDGAKAYQMPPNSSVLSLAISTTATLPAAAIINNVGVVVESIS